MSALCSRQRPRQCCRALVISAVAVLHGVYTSGASADPNDATDIYNTATPIKHVVVVIGENRGFDHIYATYVPQGGQTVLNLLSEGIVQADGSSGPNFAVA